MNSAVGIYKLIISKRARYYYIELCHHESSNI